MNEHAIKTPTSHGKRRRQSIVPARGRRRDLAAADHAIRDFVSERPFAAVGLALLAGYLMARSINAVR